MTLQVALQNVKEYLKAKIAEVDALIDTRDNSGVGDILIKPMVDILQPLVDELVRIDKNQSLQNGSAMTEEDLDALVANVFVTRSPGAKARGTVRVFFSESTNVTIPAGSEFTSADGQSFFALADVTITANQMTVNKDGDFFYVDVLVEAESVGAAGNVAVGAIVDFVGGPDTLLKVENPNVFTGGADRETNDDLVSRAKQAITVRDLSSKPAIATVLLENFQFLRDLRVVGYGDPEMERDFLIGTAMTLGLFPPIDVLGSTLGIHIGGKVDIYLRLVTLSQESVQIDAIKEITVLRQKDAYDPAVDPANVGYLPLFLRPMVDLMEVQPVDPVTGDPLGNPLVEGVDYQFIVDNPTLRFSARERNRLALINSAVSLVGSSMRLTYQQSPETVTIQQFLDDEAHRVITADLLAKFTNPAFVDVSIQYTPGPAAVLDNDGFAAAVETFLNGLEVGARLEVSDLVALLYANGASYVKQPVTLTVTVVQNDGTLSVLTSTDFVQAPSTSAYLPRNVVLTQV